MRRPIPSPIISVVAEIVSRRETHATLDRLFLYANAPGDPPDGSKSAKAQEWLRRTNKENDVDPLAVLGRLIEEYMEELPPTDPLSFDQPPTHTSDQEKLNAILARYELQYARGGMIVGALGSPSRMLEEYVRERDIPALELEFNRALANVDANPREAVSAASNILETLCKVYIEEQGLEMPAQQDLKPVWTVVRKDLGFDPGRVEDDDLKKILSGLISIVDGIGALRTHASSAHGAGKNAYKLLPRHSRLAVHSAHTAALFVLESWDQKRGHR